MEHSDLAAAGLLVTVEGRIGTITLNRPERRNAISRAMWLALPVLLAELAALPDLRLIVLRGAAGHFAAGADIKEFDTVYATREAATDYAAAMAGTMEALLTCTKPVIAAIQGFCIGGAVAISLCCDLCFADATAIFAVTPAKLGLAYAFADTRRLVARIGAPAARDLLFSARRIDAPEALRIGLVDRVTPAGALNAEIASYAELLNDTSRASIRVAKNFIARALSGQTDEDAATRAAYLDILEEPDFVKRRAAFDSGRK